MIHASLSCRPLRLVYVHKFSPETWVHTPRINQINEILTQYSISYNSLGFEKSQVDAVACVRSQWVDFEIRHTAAIYRDLNHSYVMIDPFSG